MPRKGIVKEQLAIDETMVEDEPLERMLEDRLDAQDKAREANRAVKALTEVILARITVEHEPAVGQTLRIGRFRITRTETPPKHVVFDTEPKDRTRISLAPGEGE